MICTESVNLIILFKEEGCSKCYHALFDKQDLICYTEQLSGIKPHFGVDKSSESVKARSISFSFIICFNKCLGSVRFCYIQVPNVNDVWYCKVHIQVKFNR
mgnify:FL=1